MSLRTPAAHSDYANTDGESTVAPKGHLVAWIPLDQDGYACAGGWFWSVKDKEGADAHKWIKGQATAVDPADIVWPLGWPVDADGRGLSVMDVHGARFLRLEQHTIARQTRAWEQQNATTHGAIVTALRAA
jgi:hypothetical protein